MKYKFSLKKLLLYIVGLFILFVIATVLFFNATPIEKRVSVPIDASYAVTEPGFKLESGILTGRQWVGGNSIEVLDRGSEIFGAMLEEIESAEKSITKETFNFYGDDVGRPVAEALADAAIRGVNTHFLMDYIGSVPADGEFFEIMEDAGVELERWRRPAWYQLARFNHRTHRKLLNVDGRVAFIGGANTADPWLPDLEEGGYKDYHFRIKGPVVNEFQGAFSENWVSSRGELLIGERYYTELDSTGDVYMQISSSHPREGKPQVRKSMLYAISSASESIRIGSAYFFPDLGFIEALTRAADRGVRVQILTPGEKIDQNYVRIASHYRWEDLLDAGIEMYEYQPAMYHAKIMIVDEYFVTVGSTNFDNRSFRLNDETNVNILNEEFGKLMADYYDQDLLQSDRITREEWKNRPLWQKAAGCLITKVMGAYL